MTPAVAQGRSHVSPNRTHLDPISASHRGKLSGAASVIKVRGFFPPVFIRAETPACNCDCFALKQEMNKEKKNKSRLGVSVFLFKLAAKPPLQSANK